MNPGLLLALLGCLSSPPEAASLPVAAAPPPAILWDVWYASWDYLSPGVAFGEDGELFTTAWTASGPMGTALLRGTVAPLTGEISWAPFGPPATGLSMAVSSGDGDADGDVDVLTIKWDSGPSTLRVHDALTGDVVRAVSLGTLPVGSVYARQALLQADADALPELLVVVYDTAWLFDDDGAVLAMHENSCDRSTGPFLLTGGLVPEVVTCAGERLDGATLAVSSTLGLSSIEWLAEVDADGDGGRDLVAFDGVLDGGAWVMLDGATGAERWRAVLPEDGRAPVMFDLDGDGADELVFPTGDTPAAEMLLAVDPATGAVRPGVDSPRPEVTSSILFTWDHDGDGVPSLLSGGAGTALYDAERGWGVVAPVLRQAAPVVGDLSPRHGLEVALVSRDPWHGNYEVGLYDLSGARVGAAALPQLSSPLLSESLRQPVAGDLDGDGDAELILSELDVGMSVYGLARLGAPWVGDRVGAHLVMADLDGDGGDQLVGASGAINALVRGVLVEVVPSLPLPVTDLAAADIDGDGADELLVVAGYQLKVFDGASGALENSLVGDWDEVEVGITITGVMRVWLQRSEERQIDAFDVVGGQLYAMGSINTYHDATSRQELRAIGWGLFYPGGPSLMLYDTRTRTTHTLPCTVQNPAWDVQPIPGGFVVGEVLRAAAFSWP